MVLASNTSRMTSRLYLVSVKDWRSGNLSKCLLSNLSNPSCSKKETALYQNPTNHFFPSKHEFINHHCKICVLKACRLKFRRKCLINDFKWRKNKFPTFSTKPYPVFLTAVKGVGPWQTGVPYPASRFRGRDTSTDGGDQYLCNGGVGFPVSVVSVYSAVFGAGWTCGIHLVHSKL